MRIIQLTGHITLVGIIATALMDLWLLYIKRRGVPTLDFALLGRWVGHLAHGRVRHVAIAAAAPVTGERALGWLSHYLIGIAFAGALSAFTGPGWLQAPTVLPALLFGLVTVVCPLLILQPAMGAGLAGWRKGNPWTNSLRALANHLLFGAGLFVGAVIVC